MNSIRLTSPRVATALFAAAVIAWAAVQSVSFEVPGTPAAPTAANTLLLGGVTAAPLALPIITLVLSSARD